ncbi:MAG: hypothetical protein RIS47_625 [Bacteroidota bacterium]|jgi:molybdate transport system regulatory protein
MLKIECKIAVQKDGENFLSPAKIALLREIAESGSLRSAAKSLKISYQHAWNLIDEMNKLSTAPIVIKHRGGSNGGGAEISESGKRLIWEYQQIESEIQRLVQKLNVEINF